MIKDVPERYVSVKYTGIKVYYTVCTGTRYVIPYPKIDIFSVAAHVRCFSEQVRWNSTVPILVFYMDSKPLDLAPSS
jgi:hypothetical protein